MIKYGGSSRTRLGDPLTERQKAVLDFMRRYQATHGVAPSIREIGKEFGIASPNGVFCHVNALVAKGHVRRGPKGLSRCIMPIVPEHCCPTCGQSLPSAANHQGEYK